MSVPAGWTADYVDMLRALVASGVEFLLVGAHAMAAHGVPRATIDLDLYVRASTEEFEEAWASRIITKIGDLEISVIGREPLLANKRASGRDKDLVDVRLLERGPVR